MKNLKPIFFYCILSLLMVSVISSCKKKDGGGSDGPPTISKIRTVFKSNDTTQNVAAFDSTTTDGKIGTTYAIIGNNLGNAKAIYINGVSIYFNIALASNTSLQFPLSSDVPYSNDTTSNVLTVVTANGKVSTPFVIEQPVPGITSVDQLAGNPGDVITITGTTFNGLSSVTIGKVAAQVISTVINNKTQVGVLKVQVPSGVTAGPILLTTKATKGGGIGSGPVVTSGTSLLSNNVSSAKQTNSTFGFTTPIFEDSFENSWSSGGGWDGNPYKIDTKTTRRGTSSINYTFSGGYNGFIINAGTGNTVGPNTALKFSIYGGKGTTGKNIHLVLNYSFNTSVQITLTEGKWVDYQIPIANWADASNPVPSSVNNLVFQEFSGNSSQFYLDDVGIVDVKK